ncbi:MAG: CHAT domain-containing protein [candidate division Zixibacteria bacterium]|nr:CHAT domain-containing protein [candidate division Zixibacteria bacterium]
MEKAALEVAVARFLSRGVVADITESELAAACEAQVQSAARTSLVPALRLAQRFAARASRRGDILETTAQRALARACHMSGRHAEALDAYLRARELSRRDPLVRARIDRALIDVYMYLNKFDSSKRHAQAAVSTFTRLRAHNDLAQTQVNYGNLLHRQDRHRDAEKLYREAAAVFAKSGNRVALARTIYNRANALVQMFESDAAERLYREALEIWQAEGFELDANDTRYGLAWLHMLAGKFHVALRELADCERIYREAGDPRGAALCNLDRAEVYLSLGLYHDGLTAARTAEAEFGKLGLRYETAKAALFRGQAALALQKSQEARGALERARRGFGAERNHGFLGACYLLAAQLGEDDGSVRQRQLAAARREFARAQLPLWEAMCDLQALQSAHDLRGSLTRLERNAAIRRVPQLFAVWQTLRGDHELERGDLAEARRCWRAAADRLDAVRAELPPLELRSAFGKKQSSPHLRLIAAELEHRPEQAAVWSERYKTAGVWSPLNPDAATTGSRRRVTASLEALAREVAALSHRIAGSGERGLATASGSRRLTQLQNQIREQLIEIESNPRQTLTNNERLLAAMRRTSSRLPIVQFHLREDDIVAFVHQNGAITFRRLRGGRQRLAEAMQRWRFILESELLSGHLHGATDLTLEQRLWADLGDWLWRPLELPATIETVLLLPEGELANLPWRALTVDGQQLVERHHFVIAPSFRHFEAAQQVDPTEPAAHIFRGVAEDLPEVDRELAALTAQLGAQAQVHVPARRADWPEAESAFLWHYAGHANLRADNPFYSYLVLEDGAMFAADFRLKRCRVKLVTLAACRSGEQVALPGEESTGLVRSLLEMGARNIIAGHWPVSDQTTALWMTAFYERYLGGATLLDALRQAALNVRRHYPSAYHWAAYSVFGAGD